MYGWQNLGKRLPDGNIKYTNWGMFSIEVAMGMREEYKANGEKVHGVILSQGNADKIRKEIDRDTRGIINEEDFFLLGSDGNYIIEDNNSICGKTNKKWTPETGEPK